MCGTSECMLLLYTSNDGCTHCRHKPYQTRPHMHITAALRTQTVNKERVFECVMSTSQTASMEDEVDLMMQRSHR